MRPTKSGIRLFASSFGSMKHGNLLSLTKESTSSRCATGSGNLEPSVLDLRPVQLAQRRCAARYFLYTILIKASVNNNWFLIFG